MAAQLIECIYLIADRGGVRRMTKNLPALKRGEVPIKVIVTIEDAAFRTPVIEKEVYVEDWREGVDIADVDFKQTAITKEEADMIRQSRLESMRGILEAQGYKVTGPEADTNGDD